MALDNPAGRLHDLFSTTCSGGRSNTNLLEYWIGFFRVQEDTPTERVRIYYHVMETVAECKELLNQISNSSDLLIRPLEAIEKALLENGTMGSCALFCDRIGDVNLSGLMSCNDLLRRVKEVEDVDAGSELLLDLAADVETLIETVVNTAFPDDIKAALLKGLEEIRTAIMLYRLRGAAGLRDALGKNVMMSSGIYDYFQTDEGRQNQGVAISYGDILGRAHSIISLASKAKQLAEPFLPFLKMLGNGEDGS